MRVAIFTDSFRTGLGGLTQSVINFSIGLSRAGQEVAVFTLAQEKIILDVPIKIIYLKALPIFNPTRFKAKSRIPLGIMKAKRELEKFAPDIIHNHSIFGMGWLAVAFSHFLKIPLVGTCHVYLLGFLKGLPNKSFIQKPAAKLSRLYTKWLFNQCQLVLTPSVAMKQKLINYGVRRPIKVLSNGINLERFKNIKKSFYFCSMCDTFLFYN